jgi:hypothetical protein
MRVSARLVCWVVVGVALVALAFVGVELTLLLLTELILD